MTKDVMKLRDQVVETLLSNPDFYGWSWRDVEGAAADCGLHDGMAQTLFPNGLIDAVAHFSDHTDRQMLAALKNVPLEALRSKDKVRAAIMTRLSILAPHKDAIRATMAFWALPSHVVQGQRVLWRTSDRIWNWAGDKATDYSRQTKRAVLASILMGTEMVWITDQSQDFMVTQAFLDRRLENAMEFGKTIGTMKSVIPNLFRQIRTK